MASAVSNLRAVSASNTANNNRFNAEAAAWDARPFVHEASKAAASAILQKCKDLDLQPKQVLEIGCGTGILTLLIAPHVERVVAIDAAEGMIEVLSQKLAGRYGREKIWPICVLLEDPDDPQLPRATGANILGPRQRFDLIISHLVLHHIPDLEAVLRTMFGCLTSGGKVMLTDFEDFGSEAKRFHPASKMSGVERHGINAAEMTKLMQDIGFANVSVKPEWTMQKQVESFDGEFDEIPSKTDCGDEGRPGTAEALRQGIGIGEVMSFPFLICYGEKPA